MHEKIVFFSGRDSAGSNIVKFLGDYIVQGNIVEVEDVLHMNEPAEEELFIVASKHASKSQTPTLTCHSPGNYSSAEAGGKPNELSIAPAFYLRKALMLLKTKKVKYNLDYEVSLECTHHGPTSLNTPVLFVEVGSTIKEWSDLSACRAVAEVVSELLQYTPEGDVEAAVGFGGGHYCRKFTELEDYAIGHICPKYNLEYLDKATLEQMITKTVPKPRIALAEKKGFGKEKNRILDLIKETELKLVMV